MTMHRRPRLLPELLLACALLVIASPAEAWDSCRYGADRRASLDAQGATRIVVEARAGDLEVRPATGATVLASGRACASRETFLQQTDVTVTRDGDVVLVKVRVPDDMAGFGLVYATLDLVVDVPAALPVEIVDSSGDLEARDVRVVKVTDSSGDIVLLRPQSDVEVADSSGDIRVEGATGHVLVRDSSGDIVIAGARAVTIPSDSSGDISIRRVAGEVLIEQDSSGDVRVSDVGGSFALLQDTSGEVRVADVKGEVRLP